MNKLLLSGLFFGMITLSGSTFANDQTPFPDVVKAPSPASPIPIPYPNIVQSPEKPDPKEKRVDKDVDRRGVLRFRINSNFSAKKLE